MASASSLPLQLHHSRLRSAHDPLNDPGQGFEGLLLLGVIFVAIIDAPNPADNVAETAFRVPNLPRWLMG
jgi:hypothetical protein